MRIQTISGNIGKDATVRIANGTKFITFPIAHNSSYTNDKGEKIETSTWVNCYLTFDEKKETQIQNYLKKGTFAVCVGTPQEKLYQREDKTWGIDLKMKVNDLQFYSPKVATETAAPKTEQQTVNENTGEVFEEMNLPY